MYPAYRTALVTGASRGIGAAVARALHRQGLSVTAVARSTASLARIAAELGCEPLALDLADPAAVMQALTGREYDVVVCNAGTLPSAGPFHELALEHIVATVNVNLTGALAVARAVLPGMVRRRRGHLIMIGSMFGPNPVKDSSVYAASKAAIRAFCRSLRLDLVGTNVRVTEVAPGRVETEFFRDAMGGDMAKVRERLFTEYRSLQADDVAEAVLAALLVPAHVDVGLIEITSTDQALGGMSFAKREGQGS
jgi:3-hydroxy acid dehydrogenase/malonic semialdehyde reductase